MSYDIRITADTGDAVRFEVTRYGVSYKLAPMFAEAFSTEGLHRLHNLICSEALPMVEHAVMDMETRPEHYRYLNVDGVGGKYENALSFLQWLQYECTQHPKAFVEVY